MRPLLSSVFLVLVVGCGSGSSRPAGYAGDDARDFVKKHRVALEKDIRTGSGPTLYNLAILANCQDIPLMGRRLHKHEEELLGPAATTGAAAAVNDEVVADRVVRFLEDNSELRCLDLELGNQRLMAAGTRHIGPSRSQVARRGGTP